MLKFSLGLSVLTYSATWAWASSWTTPVQVNYHYGTAAGGPSITVSPVTGRPYVTYDIGWTTSNANARVIGFARGIVNGRSIDWSGTRNSPIEASPRGHKDGGSTVIVGSHNGQEQIHVTYWEHIGSEDLMYVRSTNGGDSWSAPINLSQTGKIWPGGASLAADSQGNVFVIFADWVGNVNANGLDIWFRKFNGATQSWETKKKIENNPATKSQDPHVFLDANGFLHVAWVDRVLEPRSLKYCMSADGGANFTTPQPVFFAADGDDIGPAAIAVESTTGTLYAAARTVQFAQCCEPSAIRLATKPPGGNWSLPDVLANTGANPFLAADASGHLFMSWLRLPNSGDGDIFVFSHNGLGWSCAVNTTNTNTWKGYAGGHMAVDAANSFLYTATDDTVTGDHRIHVSTLDLLTPPLSVSNAAAQFGNQKVTLTWMNPAEADIGAIRIVYRTDQFPSSPTDGTIIEKRGLCGINDNAVVPGLTNYVTHYFAIYLRDDYGNFATPALITSRPAAKIVGDFDFDGDVDQADFGHFQICFSGSTIPQNDPACADARLDDDDDVDQNDFGAFQNCMSGAFAPAGAECILD